jgi:hypothetical protein
MFQFPRLPLVSYGLAYEYWVMKPSGLPHSEIPGYGCTHLPEAYRSVATSFIGSRRQGIHPARVLVCAATDQDFGPRPGRYRDGRRPAAAELDHPRQRRPGEARTRHMCGQRA